MENTEQRKYQRRTPQNRNGVFWGAYISPALSEQVFEQMYLNKWTKTRAMEELMKAGIEARQAQREASREGEVKP